MVEEAFVRNASVRLHVLHARLLLTAQTPLLIVPGLAEASDPAGDGSDFVLGSSGAA